MTVKFNNIRTSKQQKSMRDRECCICNKKIRNKELYNYTAFRYDKTIISLYQHLDCKA